MKKFLSLLLAMTMIFGTVALTACVGGTQSQGQQGEIPDWQIGDATFDTETPVTITFYSSMGQKLRAIVEAFYTAVPGDGIDQFQELYPNITVKFEYQSNYDATRDLIKEELGVGAGPNISYCYPDHVAMYLETGKVIALDQLIDHDTLGLTAAQKADFLEGFYNEGRNFAQVNGVSWMYTLPFSKSTEILYYNKTFFEKHGLEVPKTWDDVEELCKKIKAIDPDCVPFGYDSEANWFITMCEQMGSDYTTATGDNKFLFDNAENRAFVKRFAEWHAKGYVTTQELHGAYTSTLFTAQESYFGIGSTAGAGNQCPAADGDGNYPFEVGVAPIPQADPSNPKVISQGPSLVLLDKGNTQENIAAWLFMKFLTTTTALQASFADVSGYVPVIKSVRDLEWFNNKLTAEHDNDTITYMAMDLCLELEEYYYTSPAFKGSSTARDMVGALLKNCMENYAKNPSGIDSYIDKQFKDAIDECEMSQ